MESTKTTNKLKGAAHNQVEVILTNYYSNPLPKTLYWQSKKSNEEEKIDQKNKSDDRNLQNKFIDTKFALSKYSADELLDLVLGLASVKADIWSESESLAARFGDISLEDCSTVKKITPQTWNIINLWTTAKLMDKLMWGRSIQG